MFVQQDDASIETAEPSVESVEASTVTVPAAEEPAGDIGEKLVAAEEGAVEAEPVPVVDPNQDGAAAKAEKEADQAASQAEAD